jgi:hypothetical protein
MNAPKQSAQDVALLLALTVLSTQDDPQQADLDRTVAGALTALPAMGLTEAVDEAALRRRLEANISVFVGDQRVLGDNADHEEWLNARRGEIEWQFWGAYRRYLVKRGLALDVVGRLDSITDDVLGRLERPKRPGAWDRRGMVVGQVQSGKTSNYTGLICKAADAGYKLIVVLAGMHNSLRAQTQRRLDEGFLGLDSRTQIGKERQRQIGVGAGGARHPAAWSMTSSDEKGDFSIRVAGQIAGRLGGDPIILVIKKNARILENLTEWITTSNGRLDPATGRKIVPELPMLVIDDEADNASVNTKEVEYEIDEDGNVISEADPARINGLIRRLLRSFERSTYVGYTATPFANIFIDDQEESPGYGEDLFPRSFILRIPPPSNYLGPAEIFGITAVNDPQGQERPAQPIVRLLNDYDDWVPDRHRNHLVPGLVPHSLRCAMRAFVLVCAARAARGQTAEHNSMLVHVTRFVAVQGHVRDQIDQELQRLKDRLRYGDGQGPERLRRELSEQWESDFAATSQTMGVAPTAWSEVDAQLADACARIEVRAVNGSAGDALEYIDHPEGVSVIAVGGDKLSRGLTLEGLSVSYYLRASRMYDTLMQMGRWFGYRPGYADLCRLYTTVELRDWYRDITVANEELLAKFDEMAAVGGNPKDFALYVRSSPDGLLVTARTKMRNGREMYLTFSGEIIETINYAREVTRHRETFARVEAFLERQSHDGRLIAQRPRGNLLWQDVPGEQVADLLRSWYTPDKALKARGPLLSDYIGSRLRAGELEQWTVAVTNNTGNSERHTVAGHDIGLTLRKPMHGEERTSSTFDIRRLVSPTDESLDLGTEEADRALKRTQQLFRAGQSRAERMPTSASGPAIRWARPTGRGLLLLYPLDPAPTGIGDLDVPIFGFAVSFPVSPGAPTVSYVVPNRYWEEFVAS